MLRHLKETELNTFAIDMECISRQYSDRLFFSVLYNIAESLSRFWFYASHNFGCLVSLVSLLSRDFSSIYVIFPKSWFQFLVSCGIYGCCLMSRFFLFHV